MLAPVAGTVVALHDGEVDHPARRSPLTRLAYALTQARRARTGPAALAGNHLIIRSPIGTCVLLAHLRAGSIRVHEGQTITPGQVVAACRNSGNSTQPHVHLQAMDTADPTTALGLPMAFRRCRVRARGRGRPVVVHDAIPDNGDVVAP